MEDCLDDRLGVGRAVLLAVDGSRAARGFHHRAAGGAAEVDGREPSVLDQPRDACSASASSPQSHWTTRSSPFLPAVSAWNAEVSVLNDLV